MRHSQTSVHFPSCLCEVTHTPYLTEGLAYRKGSKIYYYYHRFPSWLIAALHSFLINTLKYMFLNYAPLQATRNPCRQSASGLTWDSHQLWLMNHGFKLRPFISMSQHNPAVPMSHQYGSPMAHNNKCFAVKLT